MGSTHSVSDEIPSSDLLLPDELRPELARQYSALVSIQDMLHMALKRPVVSVGDVVSHTLFSSGLVPKLSVFDLKSERHDVHDYVSETLLSIPGPVIHVANPPGTLTRVLCSALVTGFRDAGCRKILVQGEEDLAGLASIAYLRGAAVVYGIPGKGMACIEADGESAARAQSIIERMRSI